MQELSQTYRNDSAGDIPGKVRACIDACFLKNLNNVEVANPKILVVFSGGNAVGKSTLAGRLMRELQAVVLENDAIKRCIKQHFPAFDRDERNIYTWKYSMGLYERISSVTSNGFIVRDGVIDWYFDRILPVFERQGYRIFIIAFDISRQKNIELIMARGDTPTVSAERLVGLINEHEIHTARFRKQYTPDIVLTDETLLDHDAVLRLLRKELGAMKGRATRALD